MRGSIDKQADVKIKKYSVHWVIIRSGVVISLLFHYIYDKHISLATLDRQYFH